MSKNIIVKATQEKISKLTIAFKLSGKIECASLLGTRLIEATMEKLPEALVEKLSEAVRLDGDFLCYLSPSEMLELQLPSMTTPAARVRFLLRIFFGPFVGDGKERELGHSGRFFHITDPWRMYLSARRILAESYVEIITVKS